MRVIAFLISEYLNFVQLQSLVKTAENLEISVLVEFQIRGVGKNN